LSLGVSYISELFTFDVYARTRLRPAALARYRALSALLRRSSISEFADCEATPKLAVILNVSILDLINFEPFTDTSHPARSCSAMSFAFLSTSVVRGKSFTFWTNGAFFWNARKLLIVFRKLDDLQRGRMIAPP
jgi:hypothetical protein